MISSKPTSGESARFHLSDYRRVGRRNFRVAVHSSTIQKLIWPSRRANTFRNLPDGEAAKLEEAQQQAEHKEWHRSMEDRCSEIHLTFGVAGNPDPTRPTVTRSATLA